jgi:hypothetical protein
MAGWASHPTSTQLSKMAILHKLATRAVRFVTLQWGRKSNSPGQRTCAIPCSFSLFFKVFLSVKFVKLTNEPTQNEKKNKNGMYKGRRKLIYKE